MRPALFFCFCALASGVWFFLVSWVYLSNDVFMASLLLNSLSGDRAEGSGLESAREVLELFYGSYGADKVRLVLFSVFQAYALNDKKGFLNMDIGEGEVAELFDGLVELVAAVGVLMESGRIEGVGG